MFAAQNQQLFINFAISALIVGFYSFLHILKNVYFHFKEFVIKIQREK